MRTAGRSRPRARRAALPASAVACAALAWAAGCANDPFDPASLPNARPVARIFVTAPPGGDLNATSYYRRTFHWSGTDADGFVTAYYVSIETEAGAAAPWDTTARTDTTMTFTTDDQGRAQALVRVACRDDRGAVSDTVSQFIPLRNFPPVINFVADYDTTRWSYGAANFRLFAVDLDGHETMDDSLVYWLDTADTNLAPLPEGDPAADPNQRPVVKPFADPRQGTFAVDLRGIAAPGQRTLTIAVGDEADATSRFDWTWEVLPARGPVLLVDDYSGSVDVPVYHGAMDSIYGPGQWSRWDMSLGLPDRLWVLLETMRQFEAVFWYTGVATSPNLNAAHGLVTEYLYPTDEGAQAGRLLLIAKGLIGGAITLPPSFVQNTLGVSRTPTQPTFQIPQDKTAHGLRPGLPDLHFSSGYGTAVGLTALAGAEPVYQMEYYLFWSPQRRPPYEPFVGVRKPTAAESEQARSLTLVMQFEHVVPADAVAAVRGMLGELGVSMP